MKQLEVIQHCKVMSSCVHIKQPVFCLGYCILLLVVASGLFSHMCTLAKSICYTAISNG